jgi:toxin CcdB
MSQFSIYKNTNPNTKKVYPYLIDIQSSLLDILDTRLVIPMSLKSNFNETQIKDLNPLINFNGMEYLLLTQQMAAIHAKNLGTQVGNISEMRPAILASIDLLITGF